MSDLKGLTGNKTIKKIKCLVGLFCIGGLVYNIVEVLWRGYTHWSMFFAGGLCFTLIGTIQRVCKRGLFLKCALCAAAITLVEFCCGCIVNLWLKMHVWDYSNMLLNIKGQVCALYSVLWGALSIIAMPLYRRCRSHLEGKDEKAPALEKRAG